MGQGMANNQRAYPRSRGATSTWCFSNGLLSGLSPLARGNRAEFLVQRARVGPIPARAGQPACRSGRGWCWRAYPRSRGATDLRAKFPVARLGLSPLARGNPKLLVYLASPLGPIPARAGQPGGAATQRCAPKAYPRSRGATSTEVPVRVVSRGLSPLARGNLVGGGGRGFQWGPIPARAGQPCSTARSQLLARAYPRSRGATGRSRRSRR